MSELIWFHWTTNPDYMDMLSKPIIRTDKQVNKAKLKRDIARRKRK